MLFVATHQRRYDVINLLIVTEHDMTGIWMEEKDNGRKEDCKKIRDQ